MHGNETDWIAEQRKDNEIMMFDICNKYLCLDKMLFDIKR